jgi:hypothetical protein
VSAWSGCSFLPKLELQYGEFLYRNDSLSPITATQSYGSISAIGFSVSTMVEKHV